MYDHMMTANINLKKRESFDAALLHVLCICLCLHYGMIHYTRKSFSMLFPTFHALPHPLRDGRHQHHRPNIGQSLRITVLFFGRKVS